MDIRSVVRRLRGDLDWITMRALEKDPARRYGSPGELAADITRHLNHEPVLASPPSRFYRFKKFTLKHKLGVGFSATVALLLVIGMVITTRESNRADLAAQRAVRKAAAANEQSNFLVSVFDLHPDRDLARMQVDAAVARVEREYAEQPEQRARLLYPLGRIYNNLGFEEGRPLMMRAMREMLASMGPEDPEALAAMRDRAIDLMTVGELDEGHELLRTVVENRRRTLGHGHPETLDALAFLGRLLETQGRLDEAEQLLSDGYRDARRSLGDSHPTTLRLKSYMALVRMHRGELREAEQALREVADGLTRVLGEDHFAVLGCWFKIATLRAAQQDPDSAVEILDRIIRAGWAYHWTGGSRTPTHIALVEDPAFAALSGHPGFEALVSPDGFLAALENGRTAAWNRDFRTAEASLRLAVDRGFCNASVLLEDDDLLPLQTRDELQRIAASVGDHPACR
jgi:tetratricopeptide (TPR) repeat protein